jgi:hypothetical protein
MASLALTFHRTRGGGHCYWEGARNGVSRTPLARLNCRACYVTSVFLFQENPRLKSQFRPLQCWHNRSASDQEAYFGFLSRELKQAAADSSLILALPKTDAS